VGDYCTFIICLSSHLTNLITDHSLSFSSFQLHLRSTLGTQGLVTAEALKKDKDLWWRKQPR
jgi:hypothetical protein